MPKDVPVARQVRLLAVIAVAGAAPLTVGVILWVIGTVGQAGYHGRWAATAGLGEVLMMAGLLCGLCVFVLAASGVRWTLRPGGGPPGRPVHPGPRGQDQPHLAHPGHPGPGGRANAE